MRGSCTCRPVLALSADAVLRRPGWRARGAGGLANQGVPMSPTARPAVPANAYRSSGVARWMSAREIQREPMPAEPSFGRRLSQPEAPAPISGGVTSRYALGGAVARREASCDTPNDHAVRHPRRAGAARPVAVSVPIRRAPALLPGPERAPRMPTWTSPVGSDRPSGSHRGHTAEEMVMLITAVPGSFADRAAVTEVAGAAWGSC